MNNLIKINIVVGFVFFTTSCIMPPRGVETPPIKPLPDIAEHTVRVNQVGYFPNRKKIAAYRSDSQTPLSWQLFDNKQKKIAEGKTTPIGLDDDSGEHVHLIDFSTTQVEGTGFTLRVGNEKSVPFAISSKLYEGLRRDAVRYFYMNRSGIPLEMPYVEDPSAERDAGHLSDKSVRCETGQKCDYRKDVSGGWYDAGDYGKYVVNGGISVWMLMHIYEFLYVNRTPHTQPKNLNIPESTNDVPDILDEARYEMEWMLKMQVTDKEQEFYGMVHHRVRNSEYTAMGKAPPEVNVDPPRYLRDVATSATLNLAATGALCARVFKPFDDAFAQKCLDAAELAWTAARMHPSERAVGVGFVPYQNPDVSDDYFWASAELWVATGKTAYYNFILQSPYYEKFTHRAGGSTSAFNWADTDGLGAVALATCSRPEKPELVEKKQQQLIAFADSLLALMEKQGYRFPLDKRTYPWGSNSFIVNNAVVLAVAYRLTSEDKYLDGAIVAVDYILGRNPLDFSYVSGYGTLAMQFPHHRFFAPSYNNKLPFIPPGTLAGGPNTNLQDSTSRSFRAGCPPAKCYVDHIEAYATNEVAINWNAALAWIAIYLDETAR
ncbi:MAG: glycoside hydrolase family 9 protein [Deltaproteobacteria bacterium]|nr:glycoside hydrolase family 9 protein [Deltaproteobacteria bacterium]MBN2670311.1 glycoside hydrolase family 9 protein [Deltaproteobacteria bacterium]